ncbi:cell wall-binding repeat-containing protein [Kineococcus sp. SYSU DK006]|uniref:cell wall-binding repeat-containing protein n=1 Tax=Kineococcus sp. SYSU DK006 TaxID=3383127 RepID=UPI003D7E60FA
MTAAPVARSRRPRAAAAWLLVAALPATAVVTASSAAAAPGTYRASAFAGGGATPVAHGVDASAAQLAGPRAVAVDKSGNVYVADTGNSVVEKIDTAGKVTIVAGSIAVDGTPLPGIPADKKLRTPTGVAVDAAGNVYIADPGNDVVVKVAVPATAPADGGLEGGALTVVAGKVGVEAPPLNGPATASALDDPTGVAVDAAGNVYIADTGNNKVEVVKGAELSIVAGAGHVGAPAPGPALSSPLSGPTGVAVDGSGNVYIADTGNHVVEKVDATGKLSVLGTIGSAAGTPTGIAVDRFGTVFVADPAGGTVQQFTGSTPAALPLTDGATPAAPVTLTDPRGIAVDVLGKVYVAETSAHRVRALTNTAAPAAPRVTSQAPTLGAVKSAFSHTFTATGTPAPTWSVLGTLPAGLSLNPVTGVLSGFPTTPGPATFTVRAENSTGHDDQVVTLVVAAVAAAPTAVTAAAGDGRAVLTWTAPKETGIGPVTGYSIVPIKDGVAQAPVTAPATASKLTVKGLTNGAPYTFTVAATTVAGPGTPSAATTAVTPYATVKKPVFDAKGYRFAGADRISTAITASKAMYPTTGSAGAVVVSAASRYADALAGARLASAVSAPLLLTDTDVLTKSVAEEVKRVLAPGGTVYVLGGTGVVSTPAYTSLTELSATFEVKRIAGDDRFSTAAAIADEVTAVVPTTTTAPVYLASGTNFPDGLAVSALAARTGGVVLLTDGAALAPATAQYLAKNDPKGERVVAVGGPAAAAASSLADATGIAARKVVGADRFATARLVAERFATTAGTPTRSVGVATGENWPDALVASAAMGTIGGPLLLTGGADLNPEAKGALDKLNTAKPLSTGFVFGGNAMVTDKAAATFGGYLHVD